MSLENAVDTLSSRISDMKIKDVDGKLGSQLRLKIDESLTLKGYLKSLRPLVPGPITLEGNAKSEEKLYVIIIVKKVSKMTCDRRKTIQ